MDCLDEDFEDQDSDLDHQTTHDHDYETHLNASGFELNMEASPSFYNFMGNDDVDYAKTVDGATVSADSTAMLQKQSAVSPHISAVSPDASAVSCEIEPLANVSNENIHIHLANSHHATNPSLK